MGNGVDADPCRELVAGSLVKYTCGEPPGIVQYVTHLDDAYNSISPQSIMRDDVCKLPCEPIRGTADCNNMKDTMMTLSKNHNANGRGNVSYPKNPSCMSHADILAH